ncbi:hypothetical protein QE435_002567 [Rhizobium sp. SORGH_AS 787]|nr:hypothetical protein [Rhizobium sp. SORGH_AS_0787]
MPCRIKWKVMDVDARVKAAPEGEGGAETGMGYGGSPIGETSRFPTILRRESKLFFESASLSNGGGSVGHLSARLNGDRLDRTFGVCPSPIAFALTKTCSARTYPLNKEAL